MKLVFGYAFSIPFIANMIRSSRGTCCFLVPEGKTFSINVGILVDFCIHKSYKPKVFAIVDQNKRKRTCLGFIDKSFN